MTDSPSAPNTVVEWAWAGAGLDGDESGDCYVVASLPHGALLAVIDGLGHGPEAARASCAAAAILQDHAALPIGDLLARCHEGLRQTRGCVMSLATVDARAASIDWCGVGNVESALFRATPGAGRAREALVCPGGVVGYRLPATKVSKVSLRARDVLVMATDGIREDFSDSLDLTGDAQLIADAIFTRYARGSDDALVLVARYLGAGP
jgi:negative regulator of sigma-B (phosphoserine phosphatase)